MGVIGEDRLETKPDAKSLEEFGTVETFQQVEMNRGCRFLFRLKPYMGEGEPKLPFVMVVIHFFCLYEERERSKHDRSEVNNR